MNDLVVLGSIVVFFAVWVTAHVATIFGLAMRTPRWRAIVAFFVVPLAPYWALRDRMRVRAALWVLGAIGYAVAAFLGKK
ncbi:MAG: hypothetical protein JWM74_4640 [Myxococcaceae bacterium]|jgi:hypothetical protein|nr:hypothetical protein [Myxococcaceae bacterium]